MYYTKESVFFIDGNWINASEARIDLLNQTLHYGYGAFEGIRAYQSPTGMSLFKATEHYNRLLNSVATLQLQIPYTAAELVEITHNLLVKNNLRNAYIRPLVFMGPNMRLTLRDKPRLLIAAWEWAGLSEISKISGKIAFLLLLIVPMLGVAFWTQILELLSQLLEWPGIKE